MRVRPDGTREHLASGLRYVMGLQFNRHGDLFATDQEGATWCPNPRPDGLPAIRQPTGLRYWHAF
jgi:glucose/arabinose dehydrogenase